MEIVVQINGKVRERLHIPANMKPAEMQQYVMGLAPVQELIAGKQVIKVIPVPGKLLNIVVK